MLKCIYGVGSYYSILEYVDGFLLESHRNGRKVFLSGREADMFRISVDYAIRNAPTEEKGIDTVCRAYKRRMVTQD